MVMVQRTAMKYYLGLVLIFHGCSNDCSNIYGGWHYQNELDEYSELWLSKNDLALTIDEGSYTIELYHFKKKKDTLEFYQIRLENQEFWIRLIGCKKDTIRIGLESREEFVLQRIEGVQIGDIDTSENFLENFYAPFKDRIYRITSEN